MFRWEKPHSRLQSSWCGAKRQDSFEGSEIVVSSRHNGVVLGQFIVFDPTRLHGRQEHRRPGKKALAIPLDKTRGGRTDGDNKIGGFFRIKGVKILNKRTVWRVIIQSRS